MQAEEGEGRLVKPADLPLYDDDSEPRYTNMKPVPQIDFQERKYILSMKSVFFHAYGYFRHHVSADFWGRNLASNSKLKVTKI